MSHAPRQRQSDFRFYEELNDFLPPAKRKRAFTYTFSGTPSVKDAIEAIGVPHTAVDLILIDGESVGFDAQIKGGERVAVYPVFERFDIGPVVHLRPAPLRESRFVLDSHLGKLARYLRILGFDAASRNDLNDEAIVDRALNERRIIVTRDVGILKRSDVTHGYWVRSGDPETQLREVVDALDLRGQFAPFTRCLVCNTPLESVEKEAVADKLPPRVAGAFDTFKRCPSCDRLYWQGSHYDRMTQIVDNLGGQ